MADQNRFIKYGNQTMPMPDGMSLDQAKAVMARHFPELAENPKIETKKEDDKTTYIFTKQAGRKGAAVEYRDWTILPFPTPIGGAMVAIYRPNVAPASNAEE